MEHDNWCRKSAGASIKPHHTTKTSTHTHTDTQQRHEEEMIKSSIKLSEWEGMQLLKPDPK